MRYLLLILLLTLSTASLSAKDKLVRCEGTYSYTFPSSMSLDEAKHHALDNAITQAIADELGTTIRAESYAELSTDHERFDQFSRLIVKGQWVKDIHEPVFSEPVFENNMFSIQVTVDFHARKIESAPVAFTAYALRNGTEDKFRATEFYGSDDEKLYVSFQSPREGYVAIYLEDTENVLCALPYIGMDREPFHAEKDKRYVFFNVANNTYHMSCGAEPEINFIHIVFSPRPFIDNDLVRITTVRKFRDWLGNAQAYDDKMQVQSIMIKVRPR